MNRPATTQQSLGENELDWLNTSVSGRPSTHALSCTHTCTAAVTQTLRPASYTQTQSIFTHQALYWSDCWALRAPARAFQLRRQREAEEEKGKHGCAVVEDKWTRDFHLLCLGVRSKISEMHYKCKQNTVRGSKVQLVNFRSSLI